jgi:hypothetical protein
MTSIFLNESLLIDQKTVHSVSKASKHSFNDFILYKQYDLLSLFTAASHLQIQQVSVAMFISHTGARTLTKTSNLFAILFGSVVCRRVVGNLSVKSVRP